MNLLQSMLPISAMAALDNQSITKVEKTGYIDRR